MHTFALLAILAALTPGHVLAQRAEDSSASAGAPRAPGPAAECAAEYEAEAKTYEQTSHRLARVQHQLDQYPLTGALVGLALSAGVTAGGILAAVLARDSEYRSIPALWAIPGAGAAGVLASGIVLGVRARQRQPYKAERLLLRQQSKQLKSVLDLYASEGCVDIASTERAARARLSEIEPQLAAIETRARAVSILGPILLLSSGAVVTASMLTSGIMLRIRVADEEDHGEPADRTAMWATFGSAFAGVAILAGGGIWLMLRKRERAAIRAESNPLRLEMQRPEMRVVPQLGPTSVGLSLRGRF